MNRRSAREEREQVLVVIVDAAELAQQRIELLAADVDVAVASAPGSTSS